MENNNRYTLEAYKNEKKNKVGKFLPYMWIGLNCILLLVLRSEITFWVYNNQDIMDEGGRSIKCKFWKVFIKFGN